MERTQPFCTFLLENYLFGVELAQVQEVIRPQPMTRVPLASQTVAGLINLRGQIVTAINLRQRLAFDAPVEARPPMNVILRRDDGPVSLLVDEIGDVLELEENGFDAPPETLRGPARELVQKVYKLPNRLLLVLDADRTCDPEGSAESATTASSVL